MLVMDLMEDDGRVRNSLVVTFSTQQDGMNNSDEGSLCGFIHYTYNHYKTCFMRPW